MEIGSYIPPEAQTSTIDELVRLNADAAGIEAICAGIALGLMRDGSIRYYFSTTLSGYVSVRPPPRHRPGNPARTGTDHADDPPVAPPPPGLHDPRRHGVARVPDGWRHIAHIVLEQYMNEHVPTLKVGPHCVRSQWLRILTHVLFAVEAASARWDLNTTDLIHCIAAWKLFV